MPTDDDGYLGRECPQTDCEGYFKVKPGTGLTGPNLPCTCPYCGHTASSDHFWTKAQIEYAKSVAIRQVTAALRRDLKKLEFSHKPKGPFGIGISMKLKPGSLPPLRYYREVALETRICCESCTLDYSVFGVFAYCPDCAVHNSLQILQKNLALTRKQVDWAGSIDDPELQRHIVEDGLENCVSAFDAFGREACRIRAGKSTDASKAEAMSFQNLTRAAAGLQELFGVDMPRLLPIEKWRNAQRGFMRRHVLAHRAGVIDQKYLDETGESGTLLGRRLQVSPDEVRELATTLDELGRDLVARLPAPI